MEPAGCIIDVGQDRKTAILVKINATVTDNSGSAIGAFAPVGVYHNKIATSANGESKFGRVSSPTPAGIDTMMMENVSGHMRRRYTAPFDPVKVALACDNERRPALQMHEFDESWRLVGIGTTTAMSEQATLHRRTVFGLVARWTKLLA